MNMATSPDNRYLLIAGQGKSIETKLPDGRVRFSGAKSHPVTLRDLSSGRVLKEFMLSSRSLGPVAFSTDGLRFAVATSQPNTIAIYETASGVQQALIDNVPQRVASLAFAPDGRTLVSGLGDSTALVWDLASKQ
jgi:WD40 repeat protein